MWNPVRFLLGDGYDVIAPDYLGHGDRTGTPSDRIDMDAWVEDLREIVESTGDSVDLVGVSLGGLQALAFGARYPHLVRSIIAADTFAALPPHVAQERLDTIDHDLDTLGMRGYAEKYVNTTLTAEIDPHFRELLIASIAKMDNASYRASAHACFTTDIRSELGAITFPVLVAIGELDQKTPRLLSEAIAAAIPTATLVTIPGAGHLSNADAPQEFASMIRSFHAQLQEVTS
jgi:3-oxoadipate enol-lactonase